MTDLITGKVADLIDHRTVALNIGTKDGVKKGMKFQIYDPKGKVIKDPDSGKVLGKNVIKKHKIEVVIVEDQYSTASTYVFKRVNIGGYGNLGITNLSKMLTPPKYVDEYETFEVDPHTKKKISEEQSSVKVGDIVEQIPSSQEEDHLPS